MAVYVDQLTDYAGRLRGPVGKVSQQWCHLYADTPDELHAAAAAVGMRCAWFQEQLPLYKCHYDLTPARRTRAVRLGAVEVRTRAYLRACQLAAVREGQTDSG